MKENEKTRAVTLRHACDCGTIHVIEFSKRQIDIMKKAANSRPKKAEKLLEGFNYVPKLISPENVNKMLEQAEKDNSPEESVIK